MNVNVNQYQFVHFFLCVLYLFSFYYMHILSEPRSKKQEDLQSMTSYLCIQTTEDISSTSTYSSLSTQIDPISHTLTSSSVTSAAPLANSATQSSSSGG